MPKFSGWLSKGGELLRASGLTFEWCWYCSGKVVGDRWTQYLQLLESGHSEG